MDEKYTPVFLTDTDTGTKYELDFNRESVVWAGRQGFTLEEALKYPVIGIPNLFYFAFRMHHRNVPREKTDKMLEAWGGACPEALAKRLIQLYTQAEATYSLQSDEEAAKNSRFVLEM